MTKIHDLTHGWTLTILDNGAMAINCTDPQFGVALNPEQAARLREIVLDADEPAVTEEPGSGYRYRDYPGQG